MFYTRLRVFIFSYLLTSVSGTRGRGTFIRFEFIGIPVRRRNNNGFGTVLYILNEGSPEPVLFGQVPAPDLCENFSGG